MNATKLADLCRDHLEQEEAFLTATLQDVQQVRTALLTGDEDGLAAALQHQETLTATSSGLAQRRATFQRQAAALVGVAADSVTLAVLAERLPGQAGQDVTRGRQRLKDLAAEVDRLNRSNAVLVSSCLDFFEQYFGEITGPRNSGRYGRTGAYQEAACGSLFEARG